MRYVALFPLLALLGGCVGERRYTSLDIDLMPCERGEGMPRFFKAIEFDESGDVIYPDQRAAVLARLEDADTPVTDLLVFVHGWNKSPESAELDYQRFLCRLHTELEAYLGERKRADGLLIVGVFWPSTITQRASEPLLLKPLSYYRIRSRADAIAANALSGLLSELGASIRRRTGGSARLDDPSAARFHLIGHSFGGRMLVRALQTLDRDTVGSGPLIDFLLSAELLNVVLLNAAVGAERFDWIAEAITEARSLQGSASLARFTTSTSSYLFNVHSINDTPNRVLFRLASLFNSDKVECAVGACGVSAYPTLCVSEEGTVGGSSPAERPSDASLEGVLVWNADARAIVFAHSDIYKGRVARLVSDLLYDEALRESIAAGLAPAAQTLAGCDRPEPR